MEDQIATLAKAVNNGCTANDARLDVIQQSLEMWRPAVVQPSSADSIGDARHHGPDGHGGIIDTGGSAHGVVTTLTPPPVKGAYPVPPLEIHVSSHMDLSREFEH